MIAFGKTTGARLLVAAAASLLLLSAGWTWQQVSTVRRIRRQPVRVQLTGAGYQPTDWRRPASTAVPWRPPRAQAVGRGWLYEVFTPPLVYYDARNRTFAVELAPDPEVKAIPFGLVLTGVKPEQFRLQLAGYFGGPGDYVAAFAAPGQPDILLAREGRRFEQLRLTLKRFTVGKRAVAAGEGGPGHEWAASAVLHDETTGEDVMLDSRTRRFTGRALAEFRLEPGANEVHEMRVGEAYSDEAATYRVERIQLDPPEVTVVWQSPGLSSPATRVLHPIPAKPVQAAIGPTQAGRDFGLRPHGLATNVTKPHVP